MFFYIDEAGNTGNNLFDSNQPTLSYGVLSCITNPDALCKGLHQQILRKIKDDQIHANILGIRGLVEIAPFLIRMQQKMKFDFDYYFIHKPSYAVVTFFDAVFDSGLNQAVKWDWYWTPLRYLLVTALTRLLDEKLLRESWRLCTIRNISKYDNDVVALLEAVKQRMEHIKLDKRAQEVITDALNFGIANPLELDFGFSDQKMISPNAVAFQFVASSIANRVHKKKRKCASSIIVDRQSQFNKAQAETHRAQGLIAEGLKKAPQSEKDVYVNQPLFATFSRDQILQRGIAGKELTISKSSHSIGLQIVDVYLWLVNKLRSGADLPPELMKLCSMFLNRSLFDGISSEGMLNRFRRFESMLPKFDELTENQRQFAAQQVEAHREKVKNFGADN